MKKGKRLGTTLLAHNFNPALAAYKLLLEKITKPIVNKQNIPSQNRENPLLWLLDKIIKFIVKLFKGRKK